MYHCCGKVVTEIVKTKHEPITIVRCEKCGSQKRVTEAKIITKPTSDKKGLIVYRDVAGYAQDLRVFLADNLLAVGRYQKELMDVLK